MSVLGFFCRSNLSQTTVVCAQHKLHRVFLEIFSKLISTFSTFVHLDFESPKLPFFIGSLRVRCAIRTFWHEFPTSLVIGKIAIYRFHDALLARYKYARFPQYSLIFAMKVVSAYAHLQSKGTQCHVFLTLHSRVSFCASSSFIITVSLFPCIMSHSISFKQSIILCLIFSSDCITLFDKLFPPKRINPMTY